LNVVIPAAGQGTRLKSGLPKAILPLPRGETIIGRSIRLIRRTWADASIYVVVGWEARSVIRSLPRGVKHLSNENWAETNVAHSIALALEATKGPTVVVYGDLVYDRRFLQPLCGCETSAVLLNSSGSLHSREVGLNVEGDSPTWFSYSFPQKWAQVMVLSEVEREIFMRVALSRNGERLLGYEILNRVLDEGGQFTVHPSYSFVRDIDVQSDLSEVVAL
jgi:choline kinase